MLRSIGNVYKLTCGWRCAAVMGLLLIFPAFGQAKPITFTFTLMVDTNTPVPGGTGNFIFFTDPFTTDLMDSRPAVSIENGIVVFSGSGASGQRGMYAAAIEGSITTIADTHTTLPDGRGNFRLFGTPSLRQSGVAFPGSGELGPVAQGAYFAPLGGSIRTVADRNTLVPGGIGVFRGIGHVSLNDGDVAFGHSSVGKDRIFVADNGGRITLVADSAEFEVFNGQSFDDGVVAFIAGQRFIYAAAPVGSPPVLVADAKSFHPREGTAHTGFNPSIDNGVIAFLVQGSGIYLATVRGSITPVALVGAPIPEGTGNFLHFDASSPSHRDGVVAVVGFGPSGQEGIYASVGGSLTKVIDLSDSLDGKTLSHLFLGYEAVSGNQIAFAAQFADGSRGIYVARAAPHDGDGDGLRFSNSEFAISEGVGRIVMTVLRSDPTPGDVAVNFSTSDGTASSRSDYAPASGTLRFAPGETSGTFTVFVTDDSHVEGDETLTLTLSNPTGGSMLGSPVTATLTIKDDDTSASAPNPVDDTQFFVRQHYRDFLNREPDHAGFAFWTNEIESCGADARCREGRRIDVSAAFFLSIEFKETGCLVYHFYTTALDSPDGLPGHVEFQRDTQALQRGLVVGAEGWEAKLDANKRAYAEEFVSRAEFLTRHPLSMTPVDYVNALYAHAGQTPTEEGRQAAVAEFGGAADISNTAARARALTQVAGSEALHERDINRAFVLMQYFGYLRRDPKASPDEDLSGYNFWLGKLEFFHGDFIRAEMVKAFIASTEYRSRFGPL